MPFKNPAFLRIKDIIGNPKASPPILPLIPIGRTAWLQEVKNGNFPKPVKIGKRITAWRVEDIEALIVKLGGGQ